MFDLQNIDTNKRVITLKDILDVINEDRKAKGENPLIHAKAMVKVENLAKEPSFGTVSKMGIVYNDKGQTVETYNLTKKQAIAVAARLDNSRLMFVIDKLEELSKPMSIEEQILNGFILAQKQAEEARQKVKDRDEYIRIQHAPKHSLSITDFSNNYLQAYKLSAQKINDILYQVKVYDGRFKSDPRFITSEISHQPSTKYRDWFNVDKIEVRGGRTFALTEVYEQYAIELALIITRYIEGE